MNVFHRLLRSNCVRVPVCGFGLGLIVAGVSAGGCGEPLETAPAEPAVSRDVAYLLDKLENGTQEERADALAMLIDHRELYGPAEPLLRRLVLSENDLFLREQMIDGLSVMATDRLYGPAQVKEHGVVRTAAAVGFLVPPAAPRDDPSAMVLEHLVHEDSEYIVAHARAARGRLGVREGMWGLILSLEGREVNPEIADLSLSLLRQLTGVHLSADPEEWWDLYKRIHTGERYEDRQFASRNIEAPIAATGGLGNTAADGSGKTANP